MRQTIATDAYRAHALTDHSFSFSHRRTVRFRPISNLNLIGRRRNILIYGEVMVSVYFQTPNIFARQVGLADDRRLLLSVFEEHIANSAALV